MQAKLSNNIPRAPQTKRTGQMYGTFCKADYVTKKRLSSRNIQTSYAGIYKTLDNTKPTLTQNEAESNLNVENVSAFNKVGMNWAIKNRQSDTLKDSKNYRSMTSLMTGPTVAKKFHIKKNKYIAENSNIGSFMSRHIVDGSESRKTSVSGRDAPSRQRTTVQSSKNSSITRRYQLKNVELYPNKIMTALQNYSNQQF